MKDIPLPIQFPLDSSDSGERSGVLVPPVADLPSTVTYLEGPSGSQVSLSRFRSFLLFSMKISSSIFLVASHILQRNNEIIDFCLT